MEMNIQLFAAEPDCVWVELNENGLFYANGERQEEDFCLYGYPWTVEGNIATGDYVTLEARDTATHKFKCWALDGVEIGDSNQYTGGNSVLTAIYEEIPLVSYQYITNNNVKLQVDSAVRDGDGNKITETYAKKAYRKYLHSIKLSLRSTDSYTYFDALIYHYSEKKEPFTSVYFTSSSSTNPIYCQGVFKNKSPDGAESGLNEYQAIGNFYLTTSTVYMNNGQISAAFSTASSTITDTVLGYICVEE